MSFIEQRGGLYTAPSGNPKTIVYNGGVTSIGSGGDRIKEIQQAQKAYQANMPEIVKATNNRRVRMTLGVFFGTVGMPIYMLYILMKPKGK